LAASDTGEDERDSNQRQRGLLTGEDSAEARDSNEHQRSLLTEGGGADSRDSIQRKRELLTDEDGAEAPDSNHRQRRLLPAARELAERHGVSLRTGYRMLKYSPGQIPVDTHSAFTGELMVGRKTGKDGKSYPHYRRRYRRSGFARSIIKEGIRTARYGIRKAARDAEANGFYARELDALRLLVAELATIHAEWEACVKHQETDERKEDSHDNARQ